MVEQTSPLALDKLSKEALQALAKRRVLGPRQARGSGAQQRREIRGKADPKGTEPARTMLGRRRRHRLWLKR